MNNDHTAMNNDIINEIKTLEIDCLDCIGIEGDEQYTCPTCWCQGGNGKINVFEWLVDYPDTFKRLTEETQSNRPTWKNELTKVGYCQQRQDGTSAQLRDLRFIANKFGFYDAADYLRED